MWEPALGIHLRPQPQASQYALITAIMAGSSCGGGGPLSGIIAQWGNSEGPFADWSSLAGYFLLIAEDAAMAGTLTV